MTAHSQEMKPNFSAEADLVLVNATVVSSKYQFINNLRASDFVLKVDGKVTPIASLGLEDEPVSAGIIVDASESMKRSLPAVRAALEVLLKNSLPNDEYSLVLCKDKVDVVVPLSPGTERISELVPTLDAKGSTPLYDSVADAMELVGHGHNARKAIVLITDADDTSSRVTARELQSRAAEASVRLYVVQLWSGWTSDDRFALRETSELTGGSFFQDVLRKRLFDVISGIDVHAQYLIAFRGTQTAKRQRHRIQVSVKSPGKTGRYQIFSRHSYDSDPALVR